MNASALVAIKRCQLDWQRAIAARRQIDWIRTTAKDETARLAARTRMETLEPGRDAAGRLARRVQGRSCEFAGGSARCTSCPSKWSFERFSLGICSPAGGNETARPRPAGGLAKPIGSSSHPPRRRGLKRPSKFGGLGDLRRRSETCRIGRGTAGAGDRISLAASCRPRSQLHPAGGLR
jgi:hypothetical protein